MDIDLAAVYFLKNPMTGLVKVGYTGNLKQRLATLERAAGTSLERLAIHLGGREYEQHLHKVMARFREHGEWFRPNTLIEAHAAFYRTAEGSAEFYAASDRVNHLLLNTDLIKETETSVDWTPEGAAHWGDWEALL